MAFTVIFWQPVCRQFPLFIQRSEQTKTEYFCSVCPVKTLDKSVLRQLTWLGNLQFYYMFFCALRPCWIKKILAIIHANHSWIDMVFRNPTEYRYHLWSWQIQIVFNRQRLIVKVINDIERVKWFTEFGHLNRGDMLTSEQHRCSNEKKKFQRRV